MTPITTELLSIVIPLYNEADNVVLLTQKIHESLEGYRYEIIYVDDFSQDATRRTVNGMGDKKVHLIELKRIMGRVWPWRLVSTTPVAVMSLPWMATYRTIRAIFRRCCPHMVSGEYDVVTGIRQKERIPLSRPFLQKLPIFWCAVTKLDIKDNGCALKIFSKDIAKELNLYGEMHRFINLLAYLEGAQIKQVP